MSEPMRSTQVVVTLPWEGDEITGPKVFEVYINNLAEAIRLNGKNPLALEELRKATILLQMQIEKIQAEQAHPETMSKESPRPIEVAVI